MYNLLHKVCSSLTAFSSYFWPSVSGQISTKRIRDHTIDITDDEDDNGDVIISPPKKVRLHIRSSRDGIGSIMKNTITETEDLTKKRQEKAEPWRFDLTAKENWEEPVEIVNLVEDTPNKFKNQYRPPQHVRSPNRIRKKTLNAKTRINLLDKTNTSPDVTIIPEKRTNFKRLLSRKSWPLSVDSSTMSPSTPSITSPVHGHRRFQKVNYPNEHSIIECDQYSKLLNSFINKDPQPVVISSGPIVKVDLTNDSEEDLSTSSTSKSEKKRVAHHKLFEATSTKVGDDISSKDQTLTNRRRVRSSVGAVEVKKNRLKQIVSLCDDDDGEDDDDVQIVKTPAVAKVNSLRDKIKSQSSVVGDEWTNELFRKYEEKKSEMEEMTKMLSMELKISSESQRMIFNEMTVKRLTRHLKITESFLDDEELTEQPLPLLTPKMTEVVRNACKKQPANETLISKHNYNIKRSDISTLVGLNWLNDEIINFYMTLIMERSKQKSTLPKTYCFNTFFHFRLQASGHLGVGRWTKKADIFEHDLIIIPVHLEVHWCLAAIDFANRTISYYDSMGINNDQCLKRLENYIQEEYKVKKGKILNMDGWSKNNVKDIPLQMNGSDCGVFSCTFAEFLSRRARFSFEQKDMPYMRQKMVYEIVTGQLLL